MSLCQRRDSFYTENKPKREKMATIVNTIKQYFINIKQRQYSWLNKSIMKDIATRKVSKTELFELLAR